MGSDGWIKYEEEKKRSSTLTGPMITLLSTLVVVSIMILAILGPYRFSAPERHPPYIGDNAVHHIPKVIHLSYGRKRPKEFDSNVLSWKVLNPDWQIRLYDEDTIRQFVAEHFPHHMDVFEHLISDVERSNLFRYLVTYGVGGVYAEADVKCLRPLDDILPSSRAGLVLGWDSDAVPLDQCESQYHARSMQVQKWVFASVKGHPALNNIVQHIRTVVNTTVHSHPLRNVMARTGAAVFTDIIMRTKAEQTPTEARQWPITLLPATIWGSVIGDTQPNALSAVEHQMTGISWTMSARRWAESHGVRFGGCRAGTALERWPVSIMAPGWRQRETPPFTLMVDVPWKSTLEGHVNPGYLLQGYGTWFPGFHPTDSPTPLDVLGVLLDRSTGIEPNSTSTPVLPQQRASLLDIGPGYGLHTLAAATMGHTAVALSDEDSRAHAAMQQSLNVNYELNGVTVVPVHIKQGWSMDTSVLDFTTRATAHPVRPSARPANTIVVPPKHRALPSWSSSLQPSSWSSSLQGSSQWLRSNFLDSLFPRAAPSNKEGMTDDADAARQSATNHAISQAVLAEQQHENELLMQQRKRRQLQSIDDGAHDKSVLQHHEGGDKRSVRRGDNVRQSSSRLASLWDRTRDSFEQTVNVLDLPTARRLLQPGRKMLQEEQAGNDQDAGNDPQDEGIIDREHAIALHQAQHGKPPARTQEFEHVGGGGEQMIGQHQDVAAQQQEAQQQEQRQTMADHMAKQGADDTGNHGSTTPFTSMRASVVRVGAHGWEAPVLQGLLQDLAASSSATLPAALLVAWDVDTMRSMQPAVEPAALLRQLQELGYTTAVQAIHTCCLLSNTTTGLAATIAQFAAGPMSKATVNWCDIPTKHVQAVLAPATTNNPLKHVVFVHSKSPLAAQTQVSDSITMCSDTPEEHPLLPAKWTGNHNALHVVQV